MTKLSYCLQIPTVNLWNFKERYVWKLAQRYKDNFELSNNLTMIHSFMIAEENGNSKTRDVDKCIPIAKNDKL